MVNEDTSFIHRFLVARKKKNLITELVNEQGVPTKSFRELEGLILDFYGNLYAKSLGARHLPLSFEWNCVFPRKNSALTAQFSEGEIKTVIRILGKSEASGPDSFTAEFLLKF